MYDDLITPSNDPSESGQDNDSALFKYLSLLGSGANGYRQQLQEQYPPQDASMLDFLKQVRGLPTEEPQNDAMQRLSGLFKSDPPSPDENHNPEFPGFSRFGEPLPGIGNDPYIPRPYSNPSLQSNTPKVPGSTQPPGTLSGSPPTASSALPVNPLIGGKQDGPLAVNSPPSNPLPAALQQWIAANRSNSFGDGLPAASPPMQQPLSPEKALSDHESEQPDPYSVLPPDRNTNPMIAKTETAANESTGTASGDGIVLPDTSKTESLLGQAPQRPTLKGTVGRGGTNDPDDVRYVQELLNAAIDYDEISGHKLDVDGKVTPQMLDLIDQYQASSKLHSPLVKPSDPPFTRLIREDSFTLKQLRQNPFVDDRWNEHNEIIKRETDRFNAEMKKKYPSFPGLDWRLVLGMVWRESGGPYYQGGEPWKNRPMEISNPGDTGILDLVREDPPWYIKAVADPKTLAEIRHAHEGNKWTPELNIRAGIIYLLGLGVKNGLTTVFDPNDKTPYVTTLDQFNAKHKGEPGYPVKTLIDFASKIGYKLEDLYKEKENAGLKARALTLRPDKDKIYFHKASQQVIWPALQDIILPYNSGRRDRNYVSNVRGPYQAIQKRFNQDSIAPHK